jgi:NodT family efflux transporter outer membrane factor (OMF) lipoprotein
VGVKLGTLREFRAALGLRRPLARPRCLRAVGKAGAVLAAALVSGCAVGPDFQPPPAPDATGYTRGRMEQQTVSTAVETGRAQRFESGRDIPGEWWETFHSRALQTVVREALQNNSDLRAAQAALRMARHNVSAGEGAFFPTVDADFSVTRGNDIISGTPGPAGPVMNLYTGQVSVSYVPDVFGGTRRAVESLQAQADNQRFELEATYLTLTSNLVLAAVQEASLRGQIEATESIIKINRDTLGILQNQFKLGQIAEADVQAQVAAVAQVEETLPPLQRQLEQQRHLLTALMGRLPSQELTEKFTLASLQLPRDLPLSLPAQLVQQRPDIRAAEENLHSTSALIGVAIANRLPNITLTGNPLTSASQINQLFIPPNNLWSIAGDITQPVFQGGTLLFRELSAKDAFDQAAAQYRSTVVVAFQNVADSLSAVRTDAIALQKAYEAEKAAKRSLDIARDSLRLGQISYVGLLQAQQTYQQTLLTRVQAQANRLADTAALFQALGGGWWNRADPEPRPKIPLGQFFQ